jgi:pimeloyl-ACP methyl ester carboxylesterase
MKRTFLLGLLVCAGIVTRAQVLSDTLALQQAVLPGGVTLSYVSSGTGDAVVFIHGSLSDYTYWLDQIGEFNKHFHTIAYSRRYNFPNQNHPTDHYSAITDADDLADLLQALKLEKVSIIGHSYGALTALFFATRYPEKVSKLILAEPPAISLLGELDGPAASAGKEMKNDIEQRMVGPMKKEFAIGHTEKGVEVFIDYVLRDPTAWMKMSPYAKDETLRDAKEWEVMMTTGTLFPVLSKKAIAQIKIPVLILSGDQSYPFLTLIDAEIHTLIPGSRQVILQAGHQMWVTKAEQCRALALDFLK